MIMGLSVSLLVSIITWKPGNTSLMTSGGVRKEPVACSTCGQCFTSTGAMRVHARAAHPVEYHATSLAGLRHIKPR